MSSADMGESLVGAYLRHIEKCPVVIYNSFLADKQGEIDVVGVRPGENGTRQDIFLCEVTTHTSGMLIVRKGRNATAQVVQEKLERLRQFAEVTFPGEQYHFQWWSPYVSKGVLTAFFGELEAAWKLQSRSLEWVINDEYTRRIGLLMDDARTNSSTTGEPAYRLLQILTRLRGEKPAL